ncbi:MAG: hypothetical protein LUD44_01260 [Firmicutes bacterium]|nr:hypothetical protein [Bacillota bacterium]
MKKIISLVMTVALVVCCFAITTSADEDYSANIIANITFGSADELSGGGATATPVGDGMTYADGAVTMNDGASYFTVAKDDGTSLFAGVTEATISFDAIISDTTKTSWAFDITSQTTHSSGEDYIGCLLNTTVAAERFAVTLQGARAGSAVATVETTSWHHYDVVYTADGSTYVYVDSELVASFVAGVNYSTDTYDLSFENCIGTESTMYVGLALWGSGEYYYGSFKNLVVYNTDILASSRTVSDPDDALDAITGTKVTVNEVIDDDNGTWGSSTDTTSDHVFDGDKSTFYDGAVEEAWVGAKIDSTVISTVAIWARSANYERIANAVIQGSNDGTNWTDLYTIETAVQDEWIICDITDTTAYTYVRVYNCAYGNVAEMNIYTASSSGTNTGSNTGSNTGTQAPQTGFAFVGLGVVALASGAAIVVSKKRH